MLTIRIKTPSDEVFFTSDMKELTLPQTEMLRLLKRASTHYRFLLSLICSSSFKTYFNMITASDSFKKSLLPVRDQRKLYADSVSFQFDSAEDTEQIGVREFMDVEDDSEVVDAEVNVDDRLEDEAPSEGVS